MLEEYFGDTSSTEGAMMAVPQTQITGEAQQPEVAHKVLIEYRELGCPEQYTCHSCGAHKVRLWKDYSTSKPEQTCAACTLQLFPDEEPAKRCETKGRIPAIPIQVHADGTLVYGYVFEVPEDGWDWWHGLSEKPAAT